MCNNFLGAQLTEVRECEQFLSNNKLGKENCSQKIHIPHTSQYPRLGPCIPADIKRSDHLGTLNILNDMLRPLFFKSLWNIYLANSLYKTLWYTLKKQNKLPEMFSQKELNNEKKKRMTAVDTHPQDHHHGRCSG